MGKISNIGYDIRRHGWIMIIVSIVLLCILQHFYYGDMNNLTELFECLLLGIMAILGSVMVIIGEILQKN